MNDNAHVEAEKTRLQAEYDRGVLDGTTSVAKPLPGFFRKPYIEMTAYERGFIFGRELAMQEGI